MARNVYENPAASLTHITQANNTRTELSSNLDPCQIAIQTDGTKHVVFTDDTGALWDIPQNIAATGRVVCCLNDQKVLGDTPIWTDLTNVAIGDTVAGAKLDVNGTLKVRTIAAASSATVFLTHDSNVIKSRTAAEVRSDIGALASTSYTAADVLSKLLTVDGSGSGLDADLLDGQQGSYYAPAAHGVTTGKMPFASSTTAWGSGPAYDADDYILDIGDAGGDYPVSPIVKLTGTAYTSQFRGGDTECAIETTDENVWFYTEGHGGLSQVAISRDASTKTKGIVKLFSGGSQTVEIHATDTSWFTGDVQTGGYFRLGADNTDGSFRLRRSGTSLKLDYYDSACGWQEIATLGTYT